MGKLSRAGRVRDWRAPCRAAARVRTGDDTAARLFFETWFTPHRMTVAGEANGLFTGYYEAELKGSWKKTKRFHVPIYARPQDLVSVDLGQFTPQWKGKSIAGRVHRGRLVPYYNRGAIDRGALRGKGLEIMWVDDPVDVFFLHVQGSGRVVMTDGRIIRLGFAARNGQPYVAIGRVLIKRGAIAKNQVSMQSIRTWLAKHPREAAEIMAQNPSFIFFRRQQGENPIGAQGVPLTPGRSLAVDRRFVPLGIPLWLVTRDPVPPHRPLRRLMVAQDTGSAIKGAVRGDVFWGSGQEAARRAGRMREQGRYYLLLPKRRSSPLS